MIAGLEQVADDAKHLFTLTAAFALSGYQVHELKTGGYLVNWLGHSRRCGDLEALEAFARQTGVIR